MDNVTIPEEQIVPLDSIAPGVQGLRLAFVNVFAVTHPDGSWTLIDAALPLTAGLIRGWASKHFGRPPNSIVLTHGHFDHVSAARELADGWQVPIYAHPLEFPYLTGRQAYAPPNTGAGGGLMSLLSPMYPRDPIDLGERLRRLPLAEGSTLPFTEMPGWEVLHTPGHTPGHVSFFRAHDRMLLVGDAFCTTKPESFFEAALAQQPELHGPPAYFTPDWTSARRSVQRLSELEPLVVAPGHGKPLAGATLPDALRKLVAGFEEIAVPQNRQHANA